ncbi:MAG: GNAT family N-acetyltransferase [Deltaproteobacteria bacterium]|nr:GNAT family N-acetyltransferase [Deltaproteobacteria bacterium]MBN2844523.1 GNAT family N-acetyltransferase [Deltaproteobacteria bacterium]
MELEISSDQDKLRISDIRAMLSNAFWSLGITEKEISKGIQNSALVVGAYKNKQQVGFLRVVSDKIRFAYIMDVIVSENYRREGISRKMVQFAMEHNEMKDVYQWLLRTKDAHGVYEKFGFQKLQDPELWMSLIKPRPDRHDYHG